MNLALFPFIFAALFTSVFSTSGATALRCEDLVQPLAIDEPSPRLTWTTQSEVPGWRQSAYQILVSSSPERLAQDQGDQWDSGRAVSAENSAIYRGIPLASRVECFWKVRTWDANGAAMPWSAPARWEMGLLDEAGWRGPWIGNPSGPKAGDWKTFAGAQWIWLPAGKEDATKNSPGMRHFRTEFELPAEPAIDGAKLLLSADDKATVWINGRAISGLSAGSRLPSAVDVLADVKPGRNVLAITVENAAGPAGLIARLAVGFVGEQTRSIVSGQDWLASAKLVAGWEKSGFRTSGWQRARIVARNGALTWGLPSMPPATHPAPYLRRDFTVTGAVRRARLYVASPGWAEMRINGKKVGTSERDAGFTNFDRRVLYVAHDVTPMIREGANTLGAILGTGWFDVHDLATWEFDCAPWRGLPRMRVLLAMDFADGRSEFLAGDREWKTAAGPLLRDGIYTGEVYDARREMPGWDAPDFPAAAWSPVSLMKAPAGRLLRALRCPPVAITRTLEPVAITEPQPGVFIVDMGLNASGYAQLRLRNAPAGAEIRMRYAETLDSSGMIDRENIESYIEKTEPKQPFQEDRYITRGGDEEWQQRFTYHGYRYIEVTGFPGRPTKDNFRGRFVHTDFERAGTFACSDERLNKLQDIIEIAYLSNAQAYPTDCPQREKNGWTGDAHLACDLGLANFRAAKFYEKWLDDLADAQRPDGSLPVIVPDAIWSRDRFAIEWDAAYPLIAWQVYRHTGDPRVLARHYEALQRHLGFVRSRTKDGLLPGSAYGDWAAWKTQTSKALTANAYFYRIVRVLADSAEILGKPADVQKFAALAQSIREKFNAKFFQSAAASYDKGSQTALALPLDFGLVPDADRAGVFANLVRSVEKTGHIDTGILGAKSLLRVLSEGGRTDLAYGLVARREQPSWTWFVDQGATSLWSGWKGGGSLNHIMFGDVSAWFYEYLAGIQLDPDVPGYAKFSIRPNPVDDLAWVKAERETMHGLIRVSWRKSAQEFVLEATVPPNTTATIYVPARSARDVTEDGKPLAEAKGLKVIAEKDGRVSLEAASGSYRFAATALIR